MSAGHGHLRDNMRHPSELKHLLTTGDAPELMKRWRDLNVDCDVADLAGYNVAGTTRFLDKDFFRALLDPAYATEILGAPIDTGMSEENTVECLLTHESIEKVLLDSSNQVDSYEGAHELATVAEHERVKALGGSPIKYERGLQKAIKFCARKKAVDVPPDLCCAPYLDRPDDSDRRVLKIYRRLGVDDAFKISKRTVAYEQTTGSDRCDGCKHWENSGDVLSTCALVEGLVRNDRWCKKWDGRPHGVEAEGAGQASNAPLQGAQPGNGAGAPSRGGAQVASSQPGREPQAGERVPAQEQGQG